MKRWTAPRIGALAQGALAVLLALCLAHPDAFSATSRSKSRARGKRKSAVLQRAAGLRAYVDPATGRLTRPNSTDAGPAPAEAGARALPADASRDVPVERLANGTELARLDARFQEYEVVRVGADGKLVRSCVQGPAAAEKLRQAKPAPARELR